MTRLPALLLALALAITTLPAAAADLSGFSKQQRADIIRWSVNNSLFTLYHEMAHLLIDKLSLPVLGREEDAADNIATWTLLNKNTPEANRALEDSAEGWMATGEHYQPEYYDEDYAYGYSPDRHRALQIVCLMVGADSSAFRRLANSYEIQPERQNSCRLDYGLIDRSVKAVLDKEGTGSRVNVVYEEAGSHLRLAERIFRTSGIFEEVAEEVRKGYRLNGRVKFTAEQCGEPNAFYDQSTSEVIFCYELMDEFLGLYAERLRK